MKLSDDEDDSEDTDNKNKKPNTKVVVGKKVEIKLRNLLFKNKKPLKSHSVEKRKHDN